MIWAVVGGILLVGFIGLVIVMAGIKQAYDEMDSDNDLIHEEHDNDF